MDADAATYRTTNMQQVFCIYYKFYDYSIFQTNWPGTSKKSKCN